MTKVSQHDIVRYGAAAATLKASVKPRQWHQIVKFAHKNGYTVRSAVSDTPNILKERTVGSLRNEALRTVAKTYRPAEKALDTRQQAIMFTDAKRKADDASYRQWLAGETEKLDAQARAADSTLATEQQGIQTDVENSMAAAKADSLKRIAAQTGTVSNPAQSTSLDMTAADQASRERVANARQRSNDVATIAEGSRGVANASLLAQQSANEASRQADTWKALADVADDRNKLTFQRAADAANAVQHALDNEVSKAQSNTQTDLAAAELGVKQQTLAEQVKEATQKFGLAKAQFSLDTWKAHHGAAVDAAKIQLGYAGIKERKGKAAADRALKVWLQKQSNRQHAKDRAQKGRLAKGKNGVTTDERKVYRSVQTAAAMLAKGRSRVYLRQQGVDDGLIQLAENYNANGGHLNAAGAALARKVGITHVGYFFTVDRPLPLTSGGRRPGTAGNSNTGS